MLASNKTTISPIWFSTVSVEEMNERTRNTLSDYLGIEFTAIDSISLSAVMPVASKTKQPMGALHGGASCVLAETIGSIAANYCIDPELYYCVGLELNINHIKQVRSGLICATATPFHLGKTTQVWEIRLCQQETLTAISRLTIAVLKKNK